jgi:hypothetical protein
MKKFNHKGTQRNTKERKEKKRRKDSSSLSVFSSLLPLSFVFLRVLCG